MRAVLLSSLALVCIAAAGNARLTRPTDQIPDKWKFCSMQTGCPDVSTRLCAQIEQLVETEAGPFWVTYSCYNRD